MIKRIVNNGGKIEAVVVGNKVVFEKKIVSRAHPTRRYMTDYEIFIVTENNLAEIKKCSSEDAGKVMSALISNKMILGVGGSDIIKVQEREILDWDKLVLAEFWQQFMKLKERYAPIDVEEEKDTADDFNCICNRLDSCPHIEKDKINIRVDKVNRVEVVTPRHEQTLLKTIDDIVNKALDLFKTKNTTKDLLGSSKSVLGKGGELDGVIKLLKYIPFESRTIIGLKLNEAEGTIQEAISERMREFMVVKEPEVIPAATGVKEDWEKTLHPNCLNQYKHPEWDGLICKKCHDIINERAAIKVGAGVIELSVEDACALLNAEPKNWEDTLCADCYVQYENPDFDGDICDECAKIIDANTAVISLKTILNTEQLIEMAYRLNDDEMMDYKDKFYKLVCAIQNITTSPENVATIPLEEAKAPFVKVEAAVVPAPKPTNWDESVFNKYRAGKPEPQPLSDEAQTVNLGQLTVKQISEEIILDFENDKSSEYFVDGERHLIKNLKFSAIIPGSFDYTRVVDGKFKGSVWPIVILESGAMGVIRCKEPAEGYKNPITIRVFYDVDPVLGIEKLKYKEKTYEGFKSEDLDKLERKLNNSEKEVVEISKKTLIALEDKARLGEKLSKCKCSCCNCIDDDSAAK